MFIIFAQHKLDYQKGQVFPFLIVVLVTVIIMAMITVNIGQIGVFRSGVSVAADAAALSAASVLSQTLLGLGLKSDQMFGVGSITGVALIIEALTVLGIGVMVANYIAFIVKQMVTYFMALGEGRMGCANAKKTALQYALNNAGIDEPPPPFKQFVMNAYGVDVNSLDLATLKKYYDIYMKGSGPLGGEADADSRLWRQYGQNGFGRFMEHPRTGFAKEIGLIKPGLSVKYEYRTGYGWTQEPDGSIINSYDGHQLDSRSPYWIASDFDNYVRVRTRGPVLYPISFWSMNIEQLVLDLIDTWFNNDEEGTGLPWFLELILDVVKKIVQIIAGIMNTFYPMGLDMEMELATDKTTVDVTAWRYKREQNLGLWKFRYGTVAAQASARAFRETKMETIRPLIVPDIRDIWEAAKEKQEINWEWFYTNLHLFETELVGVR